MRSRQIFKIKDVILLAILLIVAIVAFFIIHSKPNKNLEAVIVKDNQTYKIINLNEVEQPYQINIDGSIPVIISVEKNSIYFKNSECPDKICVNTGRLSKAGDIAVCLPAKVSIELRGNQKEFDSITG